MATDVDSARLVLEAINDRDRARLGRLLASDAVVVTGRASHRGLEAVLEWAGKAYEHLERRYRLESARAAGRGLLGRGVVEYVWREGGEVGDAQLAFFAFVFHDGLLAELSLHDTEPEALAALRPGGGRG